MALGAEKVQAAKAGESDAACESAEAAALEGWGCLSLASSSVLVKVEATVRVRERVTVEAKGGALAAARAWAGAGVGAEALDEGGLFLRFHFPPLPLFPPHRPLPSFPPALAEEREAAPKDLGHWRNAAPSPGRRACGLAGFRLRRR